MVVVADEAGGLQTVNQGILFVELPIKWGRVGVMLPFTIKPDGADGTIVGQQLGQLVVHEFVVLRPVGGRSVVRHIILVSSQRIIQAMPVQMGIVEMQLDAVALASVGKFFEHVALEGSRVHDVVVAHRTLEHRKAVMVARGDGDVAGAGILDGAHPFVGVKTRRIESRRQLSVLVAVDALVVHHPLAVGKHGINAPVNEYTKFVVLELLTGLEVLLAGHVGNLLCCGA